MDATNVQCLAGGDFPREILELIRRATSSIDIVIYEWNVAHSEISPHLVALKAAILAAKNKGVRVRITTNTLRVRDELLALGLPARRTRNNSIIHTKLILIDRMTVITGSHNFTKAAFTSNHELSVAFTLGNDDNPFSRYADTIWEV